MKTSTRKLTLSALFLALGLVLPLITGQIPQIGKMLLPMHIPVLLCGMVCGWPYGLAVGAVMPLLRGLLFGMPVLYRYRSCRARTAAAPVRGSAWQLPLWGHSPPAGRCGGRGTEYPPAATACPAARAPWRQAAACSKRPNRAGRMQSSVSWQFLRRWA